MTFIDDLKQRNLFQWAVAYLAGASLLAARSAAQDLLQIWPTVDQDYYQMGLVNWIYAQPELIEHVNEGLQKAGIDLQVPATEK